MKSCRKFAFFFCFISISFISFGQHNTSTSLVPTMTPPSPNAYALGKYGDIPVSFYTGVPAIQIPLYTVPVNGAPLDIAISYHAGGIKVREEASSVGLGWALNAGGIITQNIVDDDDFTSQFTEHLPTGAGYLTIPVSQIPGDAQCIAPFDGGADNSDPIFGFTEPFASLFDNQPDVFTYNFMGYSGRFMYDKKTFEIILLDQDNIKFIINQDKTVHTQNRTWTVILPDATELTFAVSETTQQPNDIKMRVITWYLTQVTTVNNEKINLTYSAASTGSYLMPSVFHKEYIAVTPFNPYSPSAGVPDPLPYYQYDYGMRCYQRYLEKISFANGEVRFNYASRIDVHNDKRISSIEVYSGTTKIKNYVFNNDSYFQLSSSAHPLNQTYWGPLTLDNFSKRLKLDGLSETLSGAEYSFKYHSPFLPYKDSYGVDYWGYNTNRGWATTLVPDIQKLYGSAIIPNLANVYSTLTVADRSAVPAATKSAILEEIHYPTGGSTKFEYEPNTFYNYTTIVPLDATANCIGGGLRVARITDVDGSGNAKIKKFLYRQATATYKSSGKLMSLPRHQRTYPFIKRRLGTEHFEDMRTYVDYYIIEGDSHNALSNSAQGQHVGYDRVEVLNGEDGEFGRDIYEYENHVDQFYVNSAVLPSTAPNVANPLNGKIKTKVVKDSDLNTQYEEKYEYQVTNKRWLNGTVFFHTQSFTVFTSLCQNFTAIVYSVYSERVRPSKKETITWGKLSPGKITETTLYTYNSKGLLSELSKTNSEGDVITTKTKYPFDVMGSVTVPSNAVMNEDVLAIWNLFKSNNVTIPLEEVTLKNNLVISAAYTKFKDLNNTSPTSGNRPLIVPASQWVFKSPVPVSVGTAPSNTTFEPFSINTSGTWSTNLDNFYGTNAETEFEVFNTNGKLLQYKKAFEFPTSYKWGYSNSYPIAEIKNAQYNQFFYENFEDNASAIDIPSTLTVGYTGKKVFYNGQYTVPFVKPDNQTYTLSYILDGTLTSVVYNNGAVINAQNKYLDDVRVFPVGSFMKTFTHFPLVGITSITDENGKIIYNEYDAAGRLQLIRDEKRNILKQICYGYSGQPSSCGINTLPVWQTTEVTRCKPCAANEAYNIGIIQHQQIDVNPNSVTPNAIKWIDGVATPSCASPPDWQNTTAPLTCKKNSLNNNTGEQLQQQKDMNPCSPVPGAIREVVVGTNTTACPLNTTPIWEPTGNSRCKPCAANAAYNVGTLQVQQSDNNPTSPTWNTTRWVDDQPAASCASAADWQFTATAIRCKKTGTNQNTGQQEREQKDMNPCSPTGNQLRWIVTGTNTTACPVSYAQVNYNNGTSGWGTVTFTGEQGTYSFNIYPNNSGSLGQVPYGIYDATFNITGAPVGYRINGSVASGSPVTFYGMGLGGTTPITIYIQP